MKYLLIVGFACDVYRREPRARIFVGDKLIDEFYITDTPDTLTVTNLKTCPITEHINLEIKNFPPLKFYEIELSEISDILEMRIEIKNNDSNYNNSFMTRSTIIKLKACYFFPLNKKLIERLKKIRDKNRLTKNYAWYRRYKNMIFGILNGIEWHGENKQSIISVYERSFQQQEIGGNGVFICKLVKKYGIFIKLLSPYSCRFNFDYTIIDYFINKYKKHENQRNTN